MIKGRRRKLIGLAGTGLAIAGLATLSVTGTVAASADDSGGDGSGTSATSTPIKHLVVIFQENVSFDHYFGTYPVAQNLAGENPFHAAPGTPTVNGLSGALLTSNPNLSDPQRLSPAQAATCDQDHGYLHEQQADDAGAMDMFVQKTGKGLTLQQCLAAANNPAPVTGPSPNYAVMDYYDGNTVTALWNYAQHFAMSDNSYATGFGPSTPGALYVASGNTYGAICGPSSAVYGASPCTVSTPPAATPGSPAAYGPGTNYSDADPVFDICSNGGGTSFNAAKDIEMGGPNIGDLLSKADISWGWFQGGFAAPGYVPGNASTDPVAQRCKGSHSGANGSVTDYIPHHEPFEYYQSTSNPDHTPPSSVPDIGTNKDGANHQYDLADFWAAADSGNMPAVSYLKAPAYQDGHAGYSDPTLEQRFLADTINRLQKLPSWSSTAVVINYDDSDGWYDHQLGPILSQSQTAALDGLTAPGQCGSNPAKVPMTDTSPAVPEQARCGVGVRLPMLVISPFAKKNFVDDTLTTQTSIVRFIEDNWLGGKRIGNGNADTWTSSISSMFDFAHPDGAKLLLNPSTGEPQPSQSAEHGDSER